MGLLTSENKIPHDGQDHDLLHYCRSVIEKDRIGAFPILFVHLILHKIIIIKLNQDLIY